MSNVILTNLVQLYMQYLQTQVEVCKAEHQTKDATAKRHHKQKAGGPLQYLEGMTDCFK